MLIRSGLSGLLLPSRSPSGSCGDSYGFNSIPSSYRLLRSSRHGKGAANSCLHSESLNQISLAYNARMWKEPLDLDWQLPRRWSDFRARWPHDSLLRLLVALVVTTGISIVNWVYWNFR